MSRRTVRALYVVAGLLAVVGLGLRVVPAGTPDVDVEPPAPYVAPEEPSGEERAATLLSFNQIVATDLFRPERTPPDERYTPPELAVADTVEEVPVATPTDRPVPSLRLSGTAVGPEGSVALIDADPAIPGAEVYRVGDRVRGATIVEILETAVVLQGPGGRFTLTLPTSMRRLP